MKIVFISTEVAPWSKTGGLGDVVGSFPSSSPSAAQGHDHRARYDQYKGAWDTSVRVDALGKQVGYFHEHKKGVDRVFVDHPLFLAKVWGKTGSKLYGKTNGADYADNQERFAMFCQAALQAPMVLPFGYGEDVCFVANDWHSGLVPVMIKKVFQPQGESRAKISRPQPTNSQTATQLAFHPDFHPRAGNHRQPGLRSRLRVCQLVRKISDLAVRFSQNSLHFRSRNARRFRPIFFSVSHQRPPSRSPTRLPLHRTGKYLNARCAFTVHNIAFQGRFWPAKMGDYGLPESASNDFFLRIAGQDVRQAQPQEGWPGPDDPPARSSARTTG